MRPTSWKKEMAHLILADGKPEGYPFSKNPHTREGVRGRKVSRSSGLA
jgi:hypothetical protein